MVDLDLEKFFDRVNHDKLEAKIERISDKRVLKLIRAYLRAGVMESGLVSPVDEGTPQGGPLSPLLNHITLDELDRELEQRGFRFCRYADDGNIYVRSRRESGGMSLKALGERFGVDDSVVSFRSLYLMRPIISILLLLLVSKNLLRTALDGKVKT